jgi:SAM-dependent methyltransferase
MSTITQRPGIVCRPTKRSDGFDWDTFWRFTSRQKAFNRLLYAIHFRYYERLLDGVLPPSPRILELGAGSGTIPRRIVRRWGGRATLIDSNRLAGELFRAQRVAGEPLDYVTGDILSMPFPPIFDLVVSDGLIEHFPQKDAVFQAHLRALKPSGHVLLFVPTNSALFRLLTRFGPDMGYEEQYSLQALIELCEAYQLRVIRHATYFFEVGVLCQPQPPQ